MTEPKLLSRRELGDVLDCIREDKFPIARAKLLDRLAALEAVNDALGKERLKVLADNAALLDDLGNIATICEAKDLRLAGLTQHALDAQRSLIERVHAAALAARNDIHPGAAVLERMRLLEDQVKADLEASHGRHAGVIPASRCPDARCLRLLLVGERDTSGLMAVSIPVTEGL